MTLPASSNAVPPASSVDLPTTTPQSVSAMSTEILLLPELYLPGPLPAYSAPQGIAAERTVSNSIFAAVVRGYAFQSLLTIEMHGREMLRHGLHTLQ
jgi:hypothetical protein